MINRAKMPRQMYGLGSLVKDRIRKLIPNELASVAVKAAPFVAPFSPKTAALMRGIGRFDQRGSISDALKQGAATFAFGSGVRSLGGAENVFGDFGFSSPLDAQKTQAVRDLPGRLFDKQITGTTKPGTSGGTTIDRTVDTGLKGLVKKSIKKLPDQVVNQLIAGGITAGASLLASYFQGDFREQEPGETMEEYLAERKKYVGTQMRTYMDNYFANDPEYMKLDDAGRDAFVARYNIRDGGRVGYQTGGITMANTLAENIRRNRAAQAAFNEMIRPAQIRAAKITPAKIRDAKITPAKITDAKVTPAKITPIKTTPSTPQRLSLKDINQTGMPRAITQEDIDTFNFAPPALPIGMQSLAELDAIRNRVLAAQAAMKPTYQEALMGESWETLSDNDQYRLAMEYPGETPPRRNPDFVPNVDAGLSGQEIAEKYNIPYAKGGRVKFDEGADKKRQMIKDMLERGADDDTIMTITGATQEEIDQIKNSKAKGGMPTGIMRSNKAGVMERDYRETGGFVPVGIKEKADDVPAMLSKNEFVFTADAVRGAGNGSIERGAQKMYDTMKRLEKRVV